MVTITMHFDEGPSYIAIWLKEGFTVLDFSAMNTLVGHNDHQGAHPNQ